MFGCVCGRDSEKERRGWPLALRLQSDHIQRDTTFINRVTMQTHLNREKARLLLVVTDLMSCEQRRTSQYRSTEQNVPTVGGLKCPMMIENDKTKRVSYCIKTGVCL